MSHGAGSRFAGNDTIELIDIRIRTSKAKWK
jgi:hypothetical protein